MIDSLRIHKNDFAYHYNNFKSNYASGTAGLWYLELFKFGKYFCPRSLNHIIFDALQKKHVAAKIESFLSANFRDSDAYQEYLKVKPPTPIKRNPVRSRNSGQMLSNSNRNSKNSNSDSNDNA